MQRRPSTAKGKQFQREIERLGLDPPQAASFFDLTARTLQNYAADGPPAVVDMLLRVMLEKNISVAEVDRMMRRKGVLREAS